MTDNDQLTEEETARRRDEVVKRMLATPPQPWRPATSTTRSRPGRRSCFGGALAPARR
jgi:hypothetical protein